MALNYKKSVLLHVCHLLFSISVTALRLNDDLTSLQLSSEEQVVNSIINNGDGDNNLIQNHANSKVNPIRQQKTSILHYTLHDQDPVSKPFLKQAFDSGFVFIKQFTTQNCKSSFSSTSSSTGIEVDGDDHDGLLSTNTDDLLAVITKVNKEIKDLPIQPATLWHQLNKLNNEVPTEVKVDLLFPLNRIYTFLKQTRYSKKSDQFKPLFEEWLRQSKEKNKQLRKFEFDHGSSNGIEVNGGDGGPSSSSTTNTSDDMLAVITRVNKEMDDFKMNSNQLWGQLEELTKNSKLKLNLLRRENISRYLKQTKYAPISISKFKPLFEEWLKRSEAIDSELRHFDFDKDCQKKLSEVVLNEQLRRGLTKVTKLYKELEKHAKDILKKQTFITDGKLRVFIGGKDKQKAVNIKGLKQCALDISDWLVYSFQKKTENSKFAFNPIAQGLKVLSRGGDVSSSSSSGEQENDVSNAALVLHGMIAPKEDAAQERLPDLPGEDIRTTRRGLKRGASVLYSDIPDEEVE